MKKLGLDSSTILAHQTLHGYDNGHRMLVSSINLSKDDQLLIDRLSDLSGPLLGLKSFKPYYTAFPLPSGDFYAFCKTWNDDHAVRRGSVITHSLIIPIKDYAKVLEPEVILRYLRHKPLKQEIGKYSKPINIVDSPLKNEIASSFDWRLALSFVEKYFLFEIRPILWLGVPNPDGFISWLIKGMWPSLRADFSFCTFSLKIRDLGDRPFELLFAPVERLSKHPSLLEQQIISFHGTASGNLERSASDDECIVQFSKHLFPNKAEASGFDVQFGDLWDGISSDIDNLRYLCRLDELLNRRDSSTNAIFGILDLVSKLAPRPSAGVRFKQSIVLDELEKLEMENSEMVLASLYRIALRCDKPAYDGLGSSIKLRVVESVSRSSMEKPEIAITVGRDLLFDTRDKRALYLEGLVKGLNLVSKSKPSLLNGVEQELIFSPNLVGLAPGVAFSRYSLAKTESEVQELSWILLDSIEQLQGEERNNARKVFLAEAAKSQNYVLAEVLLTNIEKKFVVATLDLLAWDQSVLSDHQLRSILVENLSCRHPETVQRWWITTEHADFWITDLVARSVLPNLSGFIQLKELARDRKEQAFMTCWFISQFANGVFPTWLSQALRETGAFLNVLEQAQIEPQLQTTILHVTNGTDVLPLDLDLHTFKLIEGFSNSQIITVLRNAAIASTIYSFLVDSLSSQELQILLESSLGKYWIANSSNTQIAATIIDHIEIAGISNGKPWRLLVIAPKELYAKRSYKYESGKHPIQRVIDRLLRIQTGNFPETAKEDWLRIIRKASKLDHPSLHLNLCKQALTFSLHNPVLPLSEVVRETFGTVYRSQKETQFPLSIFGYMFGEQPERAKKSTLREKIVETFLISKWPVEDLIFAMPDVPTFRKVVNLIQKHESGKKIIKEMRDLPNEKKTELEEGFGAVLEARPETRYL